MIENTLKWYHFVDLDIGNTPFPEESAENQRVILQFSPASPRGH